MSGPANFRLVRLARELTGLTQTALAREAGVAQAIISRIETGLRDPSHAELEAIAAVANLPVEFFAEPDVPSAAAMFRKRAIRTVRSNQQIQARLNLAVFVARRIFDAGVTLRTSLAFPEPGELPRDPAMAAAEIRRAWALSAGRVYNVTDVVERAGGIVLHVDLGTDAVSAAFVNMVGDPRRWFVVNTREQAGDRVRLSVAHELGHALLHHRLPSHNERLLEPEAYAFASHLLLPEHEFDRRIRPDFTLSQARDLKRAYLVSIQAIAYAAKDRQLISQDRYVSLCKQIAARGWRRAEPDPVSLETPAVWPAALQVHREQHRYSDADLALIARVGEDTLGDLFPRDFRRSLRLVPGGDDPSGLPAPRVGGSQGHLSAVD